MIKKLFCTAILAMLSTLSLTVLADSKVVIETTLGNITVELDNKQAPISTQNFLSYVNSGFYKDTIFHRVIPGFMIQGGGYTNNLIGKKTLPPIKNEATNGLKNNRGTIAMARTNVIDSATSQFFINLVDNDFLNYTSLSNYGYTVFGKVIEGMDIVDNIAAIPTHAEGTHQNIPNQTVTIINTKIIEE